MGLAEEVFAIDEEEGCASAEEVFTPVEEVFASADEVLARSRATNLAFRSAKSIAFGALGC